MDENKKPKLPDWIIREGYIPPKVRVLCPDEEHSVVLRDQTAQQAQELDAMAERLSEIEYSKRLIRNCFVSWNLVDVDGNTLPQLKEFAQGPASDDAIWSKMPNVWRTRMVAAILALENPGGDEFLGGVLSSVIDKEGGS